MKLEAEKRTVGQETKRWWTGLHGWAKESIARGKRQERWAKQGNSAKDEAAILGSTAQFGKPIRREIFRQVKG